MSTADKIREGVSPAEARRLALAEIGGVERMKESVRAGRHGALLDDVGRDVRYAFRLLARQRTFAAAIIVVSFQTRLLLTTPFRCNTRNRWPWM